jgi:hypothetical protein
MDRRRSSRSGERRPDPVPFGSSLPRSNGVRCRGVRRGRATTHIGERHRRRVRSPARRAGFVAFAERRASPSHPTNDIGGARSVRPPAGPGAREHGDRRYPVERRGNRRAACGAPAARSGSGDRPAERRAEAGCQPRGYERRRDAIGPAGRTPARASRGRVRPGGRRVRRTGGRGEERRGWRRGVPPIVAGEAASEAGRDGTTGLARACPRTGPPRGHGRIMDRRTGGPTSSAAGSSSPTATDVSR